jgi:membrane protein DedA with SNARE-associated domain
MDNAFMNFISDYGYLALYAMFFLGMIGFPLAEETVMTFAGTLTSPGSALSYWPVFISIYIGTMCGMLVSYFLGRHLGRPLIIRFGKYVKLKPDRIEKAERWFNRFGIWTVFFGYFIPGVRQFSCYFAGISRIPFYRYLLASGFGALLWCVTFLTLGYWIGRNADQLLHVLREHFLLIICMVLIFIGVGVYVFLRRKRSKANE